MLRSIPRSVSISLNFPQLLCFWALHIKPLSVIFKDQLLLKLPELCKISLKGQLLQEAPHHMEEFSSWTS